MIRRDFLKFLGFAPALVALEINKPVTQSMTFDGVSGWNHYAVEWAGFQPGKSGTISFWIDGKRQNLSELNVIVERDQILNLPEAKIGMDMNSNWNVKLG